MISDERLSQIESLVDANLNEGVPAKVILLLALQQYKSEYSNDREVLALSMHGSTQLKYVSSQKWRYATNTYLLEANCNRLLDVARETYKENVSDIFQLNRTLSEAHELPLAVVYQDTGFVFMLKKSDLDGELPKGFINVSMKKEKWFFSSIELVITSVSGFLA